MNIFHITSFFFENVTDFLKKSLLTISVLIEVLQAHYIFQGTPSVALRYPKCCSLLQWGQCATVPLRCGALQWVAVCCSGYRLHIDQPRCPFGFSVFQCVAVVAVYFSVLLSTSLQSADRLVSNVSFSLRGKTVLKSQYRDSSWFWANEIYTLVVRIRVWSNQSTAVMVGEHCVSVSARVSENELITLYSSEVQTRVMRMVERGKKKFAPLSRLSLPLPNLGWGKMVVNPEIEQIAI